MVETSTSWGSLAPISRIDVLSNTAPQDECIQRLTQLATAIASKQDVPIPKLLHTVTAVRGVTTHISRSAPPFAARHATVWHRLCRVATPPRCRCGRLITAHTVKSPPQKLLPCVHDILHAALQHASHDQVHPSAPDAVAAYLSLAEALLFSQRYAHLNNSRSLLTAPDAGGQMQQAPRCAPGLPLPSVHGSRTASEPPSWLP